MLCRVARPSSSLSHLAALLACLFLHLGPLQAQSESETASLTKTLDEATKHFNEVKQKAKATTAAGFDRMIGQVKSSRQPSTVKADKVSEIAKAKKDFDANGTFPADAEYVNLQLKYYLEINKSYRSLSKLQNQLMEAALKNNDDKLQTKLQKLRKALDADLPGAGSFTAGSQWFGTLSLSNGGNVKYNLRIDKLTGTVFRGYVWDNPSVANHPEYQVEGSLDGLVVKFKISKVVQGGTVTAVFSGILTGDRMIGNFDQANAKGKRFPGVVSLSLGK